MCEKAARIAELEREIAEGERFIADIELDGFSPAVGTATTMANLRAELARLRNESPALPQGEGSEPVGWRLVPEGEPIKGFPNVAGRDNPDEELAAELEAAEIEVYRLESLRDAHPEVKTAVRGALHGWSFQRAWYYWIAKGPGIEITVAEQLYEAHPKTVRVDGHCGCPSPREWNKGFATGSYHVDSPAGLKGLAETIRYIAERSPPASPPPLPVGNADPTHRDMAYFGASEAAGYHYPGEDQQLLRDAYCRGAAEYAPAPAAAIADPRVREAACRALCKENGTAQCAPICLSHFSTQTTNGQCPEVERIWGRKADAVLAALPSPQSQGLVDAAELAEPIRRLIDRVEGPFGWSTAVNTLGERLKDQPEWVEFYLAARNVGVP